MIKKITQRKFRILTFIVLFILGVLLPVVAILSTKYSSWLNENCSIVQRAFFDNDDPDTIACRVILILFGINVICSIVCYLLTIIKKKKTLLLGLVVSAVLSIVMLVVSNTSDGQAIGGGGIVALVFNIILSLMGCAYYVLALIFNKEDFEKGEKEIKEEKEAPTKKKVNVAVSRIIVLGGCILSGIVTLIMLFIPLYTLGADGIKYIPVSSLKNVSASSVPSFIAFLVILMILIVGFSYLLSIVAYLKDYPRYFIKKAKNLIYANYVISIIYFLTGLVITFTKQVSGVEATTISYIPFLVSSIVMVVYAILSSIWVEAEAPKEKKKSLLSRVEMLLYVVLFCAITFISLFFKILKVTKEGVEEISIVGFNVLRDYHVLPKSYQLLAFFMIALLGIIASLTVTSLVAFFKDKKAFYKFSVSTIFSNMMFIILTGLFGLYYQIVQAMNAEQLNELFSKYGVSLSSLGDYKISSETIIAFFIALGLLLVVIIRNPIKIEEKAVLEGANLNGDNGNGTLNENKDDSKDEDIVTFDACPAFSELDNKIPLFAQELEEKRAKEFESPTLPSIVSFVVDYARDSRLHLSYSKEDIATFVAGLGATRLSILQGMSGTGKTSLPKIFLEALMGNCEIVEVESSWRDKNELLGYYNEFSKTFTPKKFTQALYKAKLNESVITFIVLDEMNLSRIEYYFSDFLSLMENEEDKRQIKLLNVKLFNTFEGGEHSYAGLSEDHTIKIPTNVWFIGTANRDESTFEISDKVYDRAHTMNFNKRAPKVSAYNDPLDKRYLPYETLINLISEAKTNYQFDIEQSETVKKVEEILAPYNISFGNRISKQIEEFVKVYCSCLNNKENVEEEALETILLSKVVAKLETKSVENKELLIAEFNKLKLSRCAEFVSKLNED